MSPSTKVWRNAACAAALAGSGDVPKVVINDPMQGHKELFPKYKDDDIHNLTSYLVTVK